MLTSGKCDEEKKNNTQTGKRGRQRVVGVSLCVRHCKRVARKGLSEQRLEGNRLAKALPSSRKASVAVTRRKGQGGGRRYILKSKRGFVKIMVKASELTLSVLAVWMGE